MNDETVSHFGGADTPREFCDKNRISRTRLYQLWKEGRGPKFFRNGARRLISHEAGHEWRRAMESAAQSTS